MPMPRKILTRTAPPASLATAVLVTFSGCARPLLSPEETRSPFDAYDSIRGQYAAQRIPDELGREKPNLRQRLGVKN